MRLHVLLCLAIFVVGAWLILSLLDYLETNKRCEKLFDYVECKKPKKHSGPHEGIDEENHLF